MHQCKEKWIIILCNVDGYYGLVVDWLVILIGQLLAQSALGSLGCLLIDLTLVNYIGYTYTWFVFLLEHFSFLFGVWFLKRNKVIVLLKKKKSVVRSIIYSCNCTWQCKWLTLIQILALSIFFFSKAFFSPHWWSFLLCTEKLHVGCVVANLLLLLSSCKENTPTYLDGNISISQTYIVWVMQDFFLMGEWSFYYYNLLFILFRKENFFFWVILESDLSCGFIVLFPLMY